MYTVMMWAKLANNLITKKVNEWTNSVKLTDALTQLTHVVFTPLI